MLANPRRIIAVRANMHLGQTVRFLDYGDSQMRSGKVAALKDTQATLHEDGTTFFAEKSDRLVLDSFRSFASVA